MCDVTVNFLIPITTLYCSLPGAFFYGNYRRICVVVSDTCRKSLEGGVVGYLHCCIDILFYSKVI